MEYLKSFLNNGDSISVETETIKDFSDNFSPKYWDLNLDFGNIMFFEKNKKIYFTNKIKGISKSNTNQFASITIDQDGTMDISFEFSISQYNKLENKFEFNIEVNGEIKYTVTETKHQHVSIELNKGDIIKFGVISIDCKSKYNLLLYNFEYKYKKKTTKCIEISTLKDLLNTHNIEEYIDWLNENKGSNGDQGCTGPMGFDGPKGLFGKIGPQGPIGKEGDIGIEGKKGRVGLNGPQGDTMLWHSKSSDPTINITDIDGNLYLNTINGNIYEFFENDWHYSDNIKGPKGFPGKNLNYIKRTTYNSGSGTHKFDPNTKTAYFQIIGGGGAGGGTESVSVTTIFDDRNTFNNFILFGIGGSGGSGAYAERWLSLDNFPDFTYTIGNGGSGIYPADPINSYGSDSILQNDDIGFKLTGKGGNGGYIIINKIARDSLTESVTVSTAGGGIGGDNTGLNSSDTFSINGSTGPLSIINIVVMPTTFIPDSTISNIIFLVVTNGAVTDTILGESETNKTSKVVIYDVNNNTMNPISLPGKNGLDYGGGGSGAMIVNPGNKPDPELLIQPGGDGANGFLSIIEYGF